MASIDLGGQGAVSGPPFVLHWQSYRHAPGLPAPGLWLCGAFFLLLAAPKANRNLQAWTILVPVCLVVLLQRLLATFVPLRPSTAAALGFAIPTGALAWSAVWLLGDWLAGLERVRASLSALAIMLAIGVFSYCCYFGFKVGRDVFPLIPYSLSAAILLAAMVLSGGCFQRGLRYGRFLGWQLLSSILAGLVVVLAGEGILCVFEPQAFGAFPLYPFQRVSPPVLLSLSWSSLVYLFNLPFIGLVFTCPLYRKRLGGIFRLDEKRALSD